MRYAEDNIRPVLGNIPGVANVMLSGAAPMEWVIEYDNRLMNSLGITKGNIQQALSAYLGSEFLRMAQLGPGDDDNWTRISIAGADCSDGIDISKIVVLNQEGEIITLDKIARAVHRESTPTSYFRINGLNSIYLNLTSAENANQIDLSAKVRQRLESMNLPDGYMLNLSYDASENITKELDRIYFRTGLTLLILLVFVGIMTLSWRYLMLIAISLAINMAVAIVAYYISGVEIQLYSLAGITISFNLVIDNLIVMTEHIMRRNNLRAFTAVLAATLTTVGALSVVFFLDERTMLNLKDFVVVVIINLTVSLSVALFFVPAMMERLRVVRRVGVNRRLRRVQVFMSRCYVSTIIFFSRYKKICYAVFILAFGLPVFMLPDKIDGEGTMASVYNSTIGSDVYNENIRPWVDCCLGGTLRLFVEKVRNGGYFNRDHSDPVLSVSATLPNGATLQQMNVLISKMERFLQTKEGIHQFHTSVSGARRANITIYFKPGYQHDGYPYRLKSDVISKALTLGGGSWSVYGLEDQEFNNDVRESAGSYRLKMSGYNYDELYSYARAVCDTLLSHRRIREVTVNSGFSYYKDDYTEFYLEMDKERLARDSVGVADLVGAISHEIGRDISVATVPAHTGVENIRLTSKDHDRDVWSLLNVPVQVGSKYIRPADYATIEKRQTPPDIVKYNQEYVLCLQYEYIGSSSQGNRMLDKIIADTSLRLPMGYRIERGSFYWSFGDDVRHYALLGLVVLVIFFVSSVLFNSLRQPFAIIFVIPVSFIGVFLTFYMFDLKFDQGGFAAFILLCGITVNAAIYIINEYNSLSRAYPHIASRRLYLRAFRAKITAVMLTVLSTVLGFIPFLIGDVREGFWFPLAAGTMGGLIMSMLAIFVLMPVMIIRKNK